jgi:hypothetical protein
MQAEPKLCSAVELLAPACFTINKSVRCGKRKENVWRFRKENLLLAHETHASYGDRSIYGSDQVVCSLSACAWPTDLGASQLAN